MIFNMSNVLILIALIILIYFFLDHYQNSGTHNSNLNYYIDDPGFDLQLVWHLISISYKILLIKQKLYLMQESSLKI